MIKLCTSCDGSGLAVPYRRMKPGAPANTDRCSDCHGTGEASGEIGKGLLMGLLFNVPVWGMIAYWFVS